MLLVLRGILAGALDVRQETMAKLLLSLLSYRPSDKWVLQCQKLGVQAHDGVEASCPSERLWGAMQWVVFGATGVLGSILRTWLDPDVTLMMGLECKRSYSMCLRTKVDYYVLASLVTFICLFLAVPEAISLARLKQFNRRSKVFGRCASHTEALGNMYCP